MIGRDKKRSNFGPVQVKCLVKLADFEPKTLKTNLASKRQQPLLSDLGTVLLKHLFKAWSYAIIFNLNNYWTADPVKNVKTASNMNRASVTFSFIRFIQALNACLGLPFWVNAIVKSYPRWSPNVFSSTGSTIFTIPVFCSLFFCSQWGLKKVRQLEVLVSMVVLIHIS